MQTTILFKTDKKLKKAAQDTAKRMGIPFSSALNRLMEEFVETQQITFSTRSYSPTPYLKNILDQGEKNLLEGKVKSFEDLDELFASLDKQGK